MPKTVSITVRDIVIADIREVSIGGSLDVPAELKVFSIAKLFDEVTGEETGEELSFEVFPNTGTLTALSNILKTSILADANAALQARGGTDVKIPPV